MSIPLNKYVDITSGVIGAAVATRRELILRYFTSNVITPGETVEYTSLSAVGEDFSSTSDEFLRAQKYFNFVSLALNTADKIAFAGYDLFVNPEIIGHPVDPQVANINAIGNAVTVTLSTNNITGSPTAVIPLSAVTSLDEALQNIEDAINATSEWDDVEIFYDGNVHIKTDDPAVATSVTIVAAGVNNDDFLEVFGLSEPESVDGIGSSSEAVMTANSVDQDLDILKGFQGATLIVNIDGTPEETQPLNFSTSATINDAYLVMTAAINATSIADATTFVFPGGTGTTATAKAVWTDGAQTTTNGWFLSSTFPGFETQLGLLDFTQVFGSTTGNSITDILTASSELSDNFGSFAFVQQLDISQITEAALWNSGAERNVKYMYLAPLVSEAQAENFFNALNTFGGTALTLTTDFTTDFIEAFPGALLATTDYDGVNQTINFMFKQDGSYPFSVSDETTSNTLDGFRVNYMGQTQQAGQQIQFYQRGALMGESTDPLDMNTYANEMWFKDAISVNLIQLLLATQRIPANTTGVLMITANIKSIIDIALANGTISIGKTLTDAEKAAVKTFTGQDNSPEQIENNGFVLVVVIVPVSGQQEGQYQLAYADDEAVRKITGQQALV